MTIENEVDISQDRKAGPQDDGTYLVRLVNHNNIQMGEQKLEWVTLTEPDVAATNGTSLLQVNAANVETLKVLLPKITSPMLTPAMLNKLKISDLNRLAGGILHFLYGSEMSAGAI